MICPNSNNSGLINEGPGNRHQRLAGNAGLMRFRTGDVKLHEYPSKGIPPECCLLRALLCAFENNGELAIIPRVVIENTIVNKDIQVATITKRYSYRRLRRVKCREIPINVVKTDAVMAKMDVTFA
jgi:hypothetical protein